MSVLDEIKGRLELGKSRYGHGVRVNMDTTTWGTSKNSWMEMAREEFLDALVYVTADYIMAGRNSKTTSMSDMEALYLHEKTNTDDEINCEDDNELIMYIINNKQQMEVCSYKTLLFNLVNILDAY
tara:strand:- start:1074 stop:1451 length:378 start_codon:yes stop_codon:yes gene_type:complete